MRSTKHFQKVAEENIAHEVVSDVIPSLHALRASLGSGELSAYLTAGKQARLYKLLAEILTALDWATLQSSRKSQRSESVPTE